MCAALARQGRSARRWRIGFVVAAVLGLLLCVATAVFDASLFGEPLAPGLRLPLIALGLFAVLAYPLLALVLPEERAPRRWDFASSFAAVLLLLVAGQAIGFLFEPYWHAAKAAWQTRGPSGLLTWPGDYAEAPGFGVKDLVLVLFLVSASSFLALQRRAAKAFLRSMYTGVTLVVLTTTAVGVGVLVPQIDGFEDPDQRVDLAKEHEDYRTFKERGFQKLPASLQDRHEQYEAFRWAEGYFFYHLLHLYGIGMPESPLPPQAVEGLDAFGRKYGREERDNREKQMVAAFSGRETVDEIGDFIHRNEDAFWRFFQVATVLDLNRTYKSHWFAALLTLLGTAVFFNTVKGGLASAFKIQKLGFVVVHVGVMTLLFGGCVSKLFTDRGILHLWLDGGPEDTYWRHFDRNKLARMPFAVRLDSFARKDWMALEVHFFDEQFNSRVPRYTLWRGREIALDHVDAGEGGTRPRVLLRVNALHDRVDVGLPHVAESEGHEHEGTVPLVEILRGSPEHGDRAYLLPIDGPGRVYHDPARAFRLVALYDDANPWSAFPADDEVLGHVEVEVRGASATRHEYAVRLGQTINVDAGYKLRFVDATKDLRRETGDLEGSRHPLPLASQPRGFAAVWVDLIPPEGGPEERRVVIDEVDDVEHGRQAEYQHKNVILRLRWDDWVSPGPPRYVLHWGHDAAPELYAQTDGSHVAATAGEALPLPGDEPVIPLQFLHHATFEKNLRFLPETRRADGWDADFYARTPRGLELEVVHDPGTADELVETVELATTDQYNSSVWVSGDERFALFFLENTEMLPFEWRSVLSIIETDNAGQPFEVKLGTEQDREIRVNDYFTYKGYRFFQTNAIPEDPTYSGIGVVYDPGIPIVLVGMYTIIAGTVIAFLLRPVVLASRKRVQP